MTVCPQTSLSPRQFVPKTVCPQDSSSPNQFVPKTVCPQWQFVPKSLSPGINYFGDKLSQGQTGLGTNCHWGQTVSGQTGLGTNCPGDKFFGDKLSRDKLSGDKLLRIPKTPDSVNSVKYSFDDHTVPRGQRKRRITKLSRSSIGSWENSLNHILTLDSFLRKLFDVH